MPAKLGGGVAECLCPPLLGEAHNVTLSTDGGVTWAKPFELDFFPPPSKVDVESIPTQDSPVGLARRK